MKITNQQTETTTILAAFYDFIINIQELRLFPVQLTIPSQIEMSF